MKKYIKGILLFLVLFGLDQWSKYAADTCLQGHEAKKVIDFPIFNVADCYVVVSAVVLAILIGFVYQESDLEVYHKK